MPGESSAWWITCLVNHLRGESSAWWITCLVNHLPGESSAWWITFLVNHLPGESSAWWITCMVNHLPGESSAWWITCLTTCGFLSNLTYITDFKDILIWHTNIIFRMIYSSVEWTAVSATEKAELGLSYEHDGEFWFVIFSSTHRSLQYIACLTGCNYSS